MSKVYNWGIVGCGRISTDFANCLDRYERSKIVGCAARSLSSAKNFALKFDIPNYYDNYESLINDKSIDIIYIGLIVPLHYKWTIKALNCGKHVLCEKPLSMEYNQVLKMIECAQLNNKFLLDGLWSRYFPVMKKIRELIFNENAIGKIISYNGDFGVNKEGQSKVFDNIRGGSSIELGIYGINYASMIFGSKYPTEIKTIGNIITDINGNKCDTGMSTILKFNNNQIANINFNLLCNTPQVHYICGSKGMITINSPGHAPLSFTLTIFGNSIKNYQEKKYKPRDIISETKYKFGLPKGFRYKEWNCSNSQGFLYEIQHVTECIDKGLIQSPVYTHQETLNVYKIVKELKRQVYGENNLKSML